MMQDDSNGESTFEFVDKKPDDLSTAMDMMPKTESLSSLSSSISLVPSSTAITAGGSILTNVPPPSALPSFISAESSPRHTPSIPHSTTSGILSPGQSNVQTLVSPVPPPSTSISPVVPLAFHQTTFSPVIPASKGVSQPLPPRTSEQEPSLFVEPNIDSSAEAGNAGLFGWVRGVAGGMTSGGLLYRMAEKARNSVDTMITTLDPQMREFLHSGGDIDIVVASDKEVKISPVREAFQAVFGKATVTGLPAQASKVAAQPVGFEAALAAARERISVTRSVHGLHAQQLVLAVENFILEVAPNKWLDIGFLLLSDPVQNLELTMSTQGTPVPEPIVALAREATPPDYPLKDTGFATTVGSLMGQNFQVPHSQWHEALTGVSRREMLLTTARALAGVYKSSNRSIL